MAIAKWIEIYKNKALSADAGLETFPIKRNDQIVKLLLKVRAKNGGTRNAADAAVQATVESSITKIEVSSGSTNFKSYTGEICRKIATYRDGKLPDTMWTQAVGGTYGGNQDPSTGWQEYVFPIDFCTKQDPYGNKTGVIMPAPLFDSLDLKLEYNFTISATAGFVTGGANHVFDLYALVLPPESKEIMMQKKILMETKKQDYTTVASGDQPFDMTRSNDRFLRQLFVFTYKAGSAEGVNITDLALKVDGDNYWKGKWSDMQSQNAVDSRLTFELPIYLQAATTTDEIWTRVPSPMVSLTAGTAPTVAPYFGTLAAGDKITVTTDAQDDINTLFVKSAVIPGTVVFDLDVDGSMQNMQYTGVRDLQVVLTNGGASSATQFIEQHVSRVVGI